MVHVIPGIVLVQIPLMDIDVLVEELDELRRDRYHPLHNPEFQLGHDLPSTKDQDW